MTRRSQVVREIKADIKAAKKMRLPWWGVLCVMLGALPLILLFVYYGELDLALPVLDSAAIIVIAIVIKWKLRRHVWFWITMTVIVTLHVLLILSVPWTDNWVPAWKIAGIGVVDLIAILAILEIVGNFTEGPKKG